MTRTGWEALPGPGGRKALLHGRDGPEGSPGRLEEVGRPTQTARRGRAALPKGWNLMGVSPGESEG